MENNNICKDCFKRGEKRVKNKKLIAIALIGILLLTLSSTFIPIANASSHSDTRIYGLNRHITAVEISKNGWTSSDVVFLARDDGYADALAAVPLAYAYDAPILLTSSGGLNQATLTQIRNLRARKIIILGGVNAISRDIEQQLVNSMPSGSVIERIGGNDRYHTGKLIALALTAKQEEVGEGSIKKGIITYGGNFPDALSVASHAAVRGYPILLTESNKLPEPTKEAIDLLDIHEFYAIGGESVISDSLVKEL